jgi:hypothetical protein
MRQLTLALSGQCSRFKMADLCGSSATRVQHTSTNAVLLLCSTMCHCCTVMGNGLQGPCCMTLHSHSLAAQFIEPCAAQQCVVITALYHVLIVLCLACDAAFRTTRPALVFWSSGPGLVLPWCLAGAVATIFSSQGGAHKSKKTPASSKRKPKPKRVSGLPACCACAVGA